MTASPQGTSRPTCASSAGRRSRATTPGAPPTSVKKLRAKDPVTRIERSHRYRGLPQGIATITALVVLRDKVLRPPLAATAYPLEPIRLKVGPKPVSGTAPRTTNQRLRRQMHRLLVDLATSTTSCLLPAGA